MIRIAHYSDLHASEKTKEEALKALEFIFEECQRREVYALINAGDTFDGPITLGDNGPINELLDLFFTKAQQPHYIIQGTKSHDVPGSIDIFDKLRGYNKSIHIYRLPASYGLVKTGNEKGLFLPEIHPAWNLDPGDGEPCGHISFLPALSKSYLARDMSGSPEEVNQAIQQKLRTILADFGAKASESPRPHILVAHMTVTGSETSTGQTMLGGDIQLSVVDLSLANTDYVALGHIHKGQQPNLPRHISYAGSPYHLNFGELEPKGFKIVTFDDAGRLADIEFIETPSRPRQTIDVYIEDGQLKWSEGVHLPADVRVRLYGPQHEINEAFIEEIKSSCEGVHSLKIETIPTAETRIRAADLAGSKTIREKLLEWGKVKQVEVPESALQKAEQLEEAVANEN